MIVSQESEERKRSGPPPDLASIFENYLHRYVQNIRIRWPRATGLCPFHQERTPSFSAHLEKSVFHCFGCGAEGGVKKFAELVGEPWRSTSYESRTARAHHLALAAVRQEYKTWQQQRLTALTDQYRFLSDELEVATIAYHAIHRRPDFYSNQERSFWTHTLAAIYNRLATIEHHLDILTYDNNAAASFQWWEEERHA